MGDARFGLLHARPIGQMLTGQEGSYTAPARHCAKCGARLRQRNHATLCAPCSEAAAEPYTPPTTRQLPYGDATCAWCEHPYRRRHPKQLYCSMRCSEHVRNHRKRQNRTSAPQGDTPIGE